METAIQLTIPDALGGRNVIQEIAREYAVRQAPSRSGIRRFYDTFDWRLHAQGLVLFKTSKAYHLHKHQTLEEVETLPWPSRKQLRFWWDFPEGSLKEILQAILEKRALILLVSVQARTREARILNEDQKTVLRVSAEDMHLKNSSQNTPLVETVILKPVRGYGEDLRAFQNVAIRLGLTQNAPDIFQLTSKMTGRQPGDYSSKLNLHLGPAMSAAQAARKILAHLLNTLKQNETGIRADIDTEFLHDFRVAVRRTRSVLSQIKGVFPPGITDRFKRDFAYIGKLTNRLRDLDVYLLSEDLYRDLLPKPLRPGLEPLFQFLATDRKKERRNLLRAMGNETYHNILDAWEQFLNSAPDDGLAQNADTPAIDLATKFIHKAYRKVIKRGKKISDTTPDEKLHALRIDCKKLRYLMEFFASLFPADEIGLLITQLKTLQGNLVDFNDLFVQQEELQDYLDRAVQQYPERIQVAASVGGLVGTLHYRQQEVRQDFQKTFNDFSRPKNVRLFRKLFG